MTSTSEDRSQPLAARPYPSLCDQQVYSDRRYRAPRWLMNCAIVETTLAFVIILPLISNDEVSAMAMFAELVSVLRNRFGRCILIRAAAPGPEIDISDEDANLFFKSRVKWQRFTIWFMNFQSVLVEFTYGMECLVSLHGFLSVHGKSSGLAAIVLLTILLLVNGVILVVGTALACRAEFLGYSEANLLRPPEDRPKRLTVIKFEEFLARRQADENVSPALAAGSTAKMESSCVICLTEFSGPDPIVELPCHHFFHDHCARAWFARQPRCPFRCEDSTGSIAESCPPTASGGYLIQDSADVPVVIGQTVLDRHSSSEPSSAIGIGEQHSAEPSLMDVDEQQGIVERSGLAQEPLSSAAASPPEAAETSRIAPADEIPVQNGAAVVMVDI